MPSLGAPWTETDGKQMDVVYFTMYSGFKSASSFAINSTISTLPQILYSMFGQNWNRLWDAFTTQYDPIDNYSLSETVQRNETDNRSISKEGDLTSTVDGTEKTTATSSGKSDSTNSSTNETTETGTTTTATQYGQKISGSSDSDAYTYAFNSSDQTPTATTSDSNSETHSGTDTTTTTPDTTSNSTLSSTNNNTSSDTGESDTATTSARADKTAESTTDDSTIAEDITRTRIGNIGQNSYQELLRQEFDLWKWNFFYQVFEDADKLLTLSVYSPGDIKAQFMNQSSQLN